MTKRFRNIRSRAYLIFPSVCIWLGLSLFSCAPTKQELISKESQDLAFMWLKSGSGTTRAAVLDELESRKAVDTLNWLLTYALSSRRMKFKTEDCLPIVQALGRLKDPKSLDSLYDATRIRPAKELKLAVLQAYKLSGNAQTVLPTKEFLNDPDPDVRLEALETLAHIKGQDSIEAIYPLLFDDDPNIRWRTVHVLGEIGNPRAIDRIGLLLADKEKIVRDSAEVVLLKLGVSEEKLADWKRKAGQLSIEDVYQTKITYQKAVEEREALRSRLENEADIKKRLEDSLKKRDEALKRQEKLVESLYEKERQLKSKLFQLEQAKKESEASRRRLQNLNKKTQEVNAQLRQAKSAKATAIAREELDRILEEKSKLERDTKDLEKRESRLREEISNLNVRAEQTRHEALNAKRQLVAIRKREQELAHQVDELKKRLDRGMAPVLVVSKPKSGTRIESPTTLLHIIAVDDRGIRDINVSLNENPVELSDERGITVSKITDDEMPKKVDVAQRLDLKDGENTVTITITDTDGMFASETIKLIREKQRGRIWAAIIGINQYQKMRDLKYALNDAEAFRIYLKEHLGIPDQHIFFLANGEATKERIASLLGTKIRRKASKDDTVYIFYAGHGAVEADPVDPDGDGFEKYLLPHNARLDDLYSTAISMNEIKTIFQRIRADRLIFIADTCYSGASGGRTMLASKTRATLSERFFERISRGKGRVIISSCSANEISKEDDLLKHGIFTHYLIRGLEGEADYDGDGLITVDELFGFLSRKVPEASGQDQHPVRKGETEGELVMGYTK